MNKDILINSNCIEEFIPVDKLDYIDTAECPHLYKLRYKKGEKMYSGILGMLGISLKRAPEDMICNLLCFGGDLITRSKLNELILKEELPNIFEENGILYLKPHVNICMLSGKIHTKYFNTYNECLEFIDDISKQLEIKGIYINK